MLMLQAMTITAMECSQLMYHQGLQPLSKSKIVCVSVHSQRSLTLLSLLIEKVGPNKNIKKVFLDLDRRNLSQLAHHYGYFRYPVSYQYSHSHSSIFHSGRVKMCSIRWSTHQNSGSSH